MFYQRLVQTIQLQHQLLNRRRGSDDSVADFADALDEIAGKLENKLNDITAVFIAGLQNSIVNVMDTTNFKSFTEVSTIESNQQARRPRTAVAITRPPPLT